MTTLDVILGVLILVIFALSCSAGFSSGKCVAYHDINKILGETQDD